jgi:hypothetical protein
MESLSRILIDSFDIDIQVYMERALERLALSPGGRPAAQWARENPQTFQMLLRLLSVAVQRVPNSQNVWVDGGLRNLKRLPMSIHHTVFNQGPFAISASEGVPPMLDSVDNKFLERFEAAVEGAAEGELAQISTLTPEQLQKWVMSPERLRPHLLQQWAGQSSGQNKPTIAPKEVFRSVTGALRDLRRSAREALGTNNDLDMLRFIDVVSHFMDEMKSQLKGSIYESAMVAIIRDGDFDIRARLVTWLDTPTDASGDHTWGQTLDDPLFGGYYTKHGLPWEDVPSGQVVKYLKRQFAAAPLAEVVRWAWNNVENDLHEWQGDAVHQWRERRNATGTAAPPDLAGLSSKQRRELLLDSTGIGGDEALLLILRLNSWLSVEMSFDEIVSTGGDAFTNFFEVVNFVSLPLADWLLCTLDRIFYYERGTVDEGEEIKLGAALMLEGFRPMVEIYHARKACGCVHEIRVLAERGRLRNKGAAV